MKKITKDCKHYGTKGQCKKKICIYSGHTFQFPGIGQESPAFMK